MVVLVGSYGYSFQTKHFGGTSGITVGSFLCTKGMHPKSKTSRMTRKTGIKVSSRECAAENDQTQ